MIYSGNCYSSDYFILFNQLLEFEEMTEYMVIKKVFSNLIELISY